MSAKRWIRIVTQVSVAALVAATAGCTPASSTDGGEFKREEVPIADITPAPDRCDEIKELARVSRRGLFGFRSPEIVPIPKEPNFIGGETTLVHSGPWRYLIHVPFVLYGPGVIDEVGVVEDPSTIADVAPTIARIVGYDGYHAPDGHPLLSGVTDREPRLVVTVVWDGGGWDALDRHPENWPFLAKMMDGGVAYRNFTVGSSPSVTPAIHTSLGTGAFPSTHGIVGLNMRTSDLRYVNPLGGTRPGNIEVPSLGDLYDRHLDNEPVVGMLGSTSWHIGMVGKGKSFNGGDADVVALMSHEDSEIKSNTDYYSLPNIGNETRLEAMIERTDMIDGKRDGKWRGRSLDTLKDAWKTPALVDYTEFLLQQMIEREGFGRDKIADLLFVNFKSADLAGHAWSFNSKEVGEIVAASDAALKRLARFLNRTVGEGEWVMALTADHGQTPYPKDSGAWAIRGGELADDINKHFDDDGDEVTLVDRVGASGIYINRPQLDTNNVTLERLAKWVGDYRIGENLRGNEKIPSYYAGTAQDRIFEATMVKSRLITPTC